MNRSSDFFHISSVLMITPLASAMRISEPLLGINLPQTQDSCMLSTLVYIWHQLEAWNVPRPRDVATACSTGVWSVGS